MLTTVDSGGEVQIRRMPDFKVEKRIAAQKRPLVQVVSNDSATWTLGADAAGVAVMWEIQDNRTRVVFEGRKGTAAEPVLPFAAIGDVFVVGRGRAVELWTPARLEDEMKEKK